MKEKAEARAKAKAAGEQTPEKPKMTISRLLTKEEQRIETGSQVAGAQLSHE